MRADSSACNFKKRAGIKNEVKYIRYQYYYSVPHYNGDAWLVFTKESQAE